VLTLDGPHLLANFLRLAGEGDAGVLDDASGTFATKGLGAAPAAASPAAASPAAASPAAAPPAAASPAVSAVS
jgi:hypothetical protein